MSGEEKKHPADVARALDRAYFKRNPKAKSYMRAYIEGETSALPPGAVVECVAVAFVSERQTVKAAIFAEDCRKAARQDVERLALLFRGGAERGAAA